MPCRPRPAGPGDNGGIRRPSGRDSDAHRVLASVSQGGEVPLGVEGGPAAGARGLGGLEVGVADVVGGEHAGEGRAGGGRLHPDAALVAEVDPPGGPRGSAAGTWSPLRWVDRSTRPTSPEPSPHSSARPASAASASTTSATRPPPSSWNRTSKSSSSRNSSATPSATPMRPPVSPATATTRRCVEPPSTDVAVNYSRRDPLKPHRTPPGGVSSLRNERLRTGALAQEVTNCRDVGPPFGNGISVFIDSESRSYGRPRLTRIEFPLQLIQKDDRVLDEHIFPSPVNRPAEDEITDFRSGDRSNETRIPFLSIEDHFKRIPPTTFILTEAPVGQVHVERLREVADGDPAGRPRPL